jgi:hypothetical protein
MRGRSTGHARFIEQLPILMTSLDLCENGCIAMMLWTRPDLSHGLVEVSSLATRVKIIAGVLTEALMGALAVIWLGYGYGGCPGYGGVVGGLIGGVLGGYRPY